VRVVSAAARSLLGELGEDGYREKWVDHASLTALLVELSS
jgi:hypothetical protein